MRFTLLLLCFLMAALKGMAQSSISPQAFSQWQADKYSMFIHFGLYSKLGGVWEGKPVTRGYSEQIQSFAGIFSDWYGETADSFNPVKFNADSLVALAQAAGMRSIVITTKHHDGFCMWHTRTTDYNAYDRMPCHRDFIKELADACHRKGMKLGLYFSVIDWHYPYAYPISSHNCDFVTPQHHAYSKQQVTELLTQYGPISELWFDMGSNTPAQSKELYALVHSLQPDCMVSGRLGNDQYDFSVMADNAYPERALQCPWQTAASMFNETWSFRSWQKRGDYHKKAAEKLRQLLEVVSHGGKFLLNIGPDSVGAVVPFEKEVLKTIGNWLKTKGQAVYGTEASPYRQSFAWGNITRNGHTLYLLLSGTYPKDGQIQLTSSFGKLEKAEYLQRSSPVRFSMQKEHLTLSVTPADFQQNDIQVIALHFAQPVRPLPAKELTSSLLTSQNATPDYSYSCWDYYSNYRSTVSYTWHTRPMPLKKLTCYFTEQEKDETLLLTLDGKKHEIPLKGERASLSLGKNLRWGKQYLCGPGSGVFDSPSVLHTDLQHPPVRKGNWTEISHEEDSIPVHILETYFLLQEVYSPKKQYVLMDIGAGNGVEVYANGQSVMKHLNPYRCHYREEKVLVPLKKGNNQLVVRLYNRFENQLHYLIRPSRKQEVYAQTVTLPSENRPHILTIRRKGLASPHTDTELHNLMILMGK